MVVLSELRTGSLILVPAPVVFLTQLFVLLNSDILVLLNILLCFISLFILRSQFFLGFFCLFVFTGDRSCREEKRGGIIGKNIQVRSCDKKSIFNESKKKNIDFIYILMIVHP